jgi:hypothetical protein
MSAEEPTFDELMARADKDGLSSSDLQYILNEYGRAVRNEFEMALAEKPDDADEAKRDFCRTHMAEMLAEIHWLAKNADSESVKLSAAKYLADGAVKESHKDGDPIKAIINDLMAADQPTNPPPD